MSYSDEVLNLITLSFFATSFVLMIVMGMLYSFHKRKYLLYWLLHWSILTFAYGLLFTYGTTPLCLILYSALLITGSAILHYGCYIYLGKQYAKGLKLTALSAGILFIIVLFTPQLQIFMPILVFSYVAFYYMHAGGWFFAGLEKPVNLIGIIYIVFGVFNLAYPFLVQLNWYLPWGYFINAIMGSSTILALLGLHFIRLTKEKNQLLETLYYKSYHDHLTGLYNREYLNKIVSDLSLESNLPISVLFADLNTLKKMNDLHGHDYGDQTLIATAEVLKQSVKDSNHVIRYGGDEFLIILPNTDNHQAKQLSQAIIKTCENVVIKDMTIGISIGIATRETSGFNVSSLIREAEVAMYKVKNK